MILCWSDNSTSIYDISHYNGIKWIIDYLKPVVMESNRPQTASTHQPDTIHKHTRADPFDDSINSTHIQHCVLCDRVSQWGYPLLLVLGLAGNALCLVAFSGPNLRPKTRALCCVLCALDSLALIVVFVLRCVPMLTWCGTSCRSL